MTDRPRATRDSRDEPGRVVPRSAATFKPRRRALSAARQAHLEEWLDRWGLQESGVPLDDTPDFNRDDLPIVLDIGFGHGESTIELAKLQPDRMVIGVEVHTPGVVTVLDAVVHEPLPNVRVVHGDALRFLARVEPETLSGIRVFFPDPWPKQKHHHRRLVRADAVEALTDRLMIGGELHLATDMENYARAMQEACDHEPRLAGGVIARPAWRPMTRFERRGLQEGRAVTDLLYVRSS